MKTLKKLKDEFRLMVDTYGKWNTIIDYMIIYLLLPFYTILFVIEYTKTKEPIFIVLLILYVITTFIYIKVHKYQINLAKLFTNNKILLPINTSTNFINKLHEEHPSLSPYIIIDSVNNYVYQLTKHPELEEDPRLTKMATEFEFFIKNFIIYNINSGKMEIFDKKDKRPLVVKWSD